ncbi:MAG TPA: MBL fold metallo-hydrolase [Thermoanaerobaculia bacterium]|nr:MBL fold metallo-hydrolase [Thermoanaerobaculia bacterium]
MSDATKNLYESILLQISDSAARGGALSPLPPARASAAVVPWRRRDAGGIEVFWIQRAEALPFMGGWHAFPGGALSRADAGVPVAGEVAGAGGTGDAPAAGLPESMQGDAEGPDLVPGLVACAIRELFEETGLLLATPSGNAPSSEDLAEARRALLAGERPFAELMADLGLTPDASRLVWAGRWMTPPFAPLRFDNRFFLLEWPGSEAVQPSVLPGECAAGEWTEPGAAWRRWRSGDVLAAPPILHILEVLAENGPAAHGLERLRDPSETNLGPLRRVEMRPGVVMFPLLTHTLPPAATTNAYLLGTGEAVLVDPGSTLEVENGRLERALAAARDRLGRRVTAIWLTHHHPDHVGGVERLRDTLGVPVLAHPATAERLAGRVRVDGELVDGQRVVLAGDPPCAVRVVHTPGHARGHLCFFEEDQRSLLAGDMVAGIGMIVVDPPEGDMDDYLESLEKMIALAPRTLFPAHGPVVRDAVGKLREYVQHRLWREEKILAAWNEGRREPREMLPTVYEDVPPEAHGLAQRQILAHLERLRRAGRLAGA